MKQGKQKASITKQPVKDKKPESKPSKPAVGSKPLKPAALYQDSGSGYNRDFTFPQE